MRYNIYFFLHQASLENQFVPVGFLVCKCSKEKSETGLELSNALPTVFPIFLKKFPAISRTLRKAFLVGSTTVLTAHSIKVPTPATKPTGT